MDDAFHSAGATRPLRDDLVAEAFGEDLAATTCYVAAKAARDQQQAHVSPSRGKIRNVADVSAVPPARGSSAGRACSFWRSSRSGDEKHSVDDLETFDRKPGRNQRRKRNSTGHVAVLLFGKSPYGPSTASGLSQSPSSTPITPLTGPFCTPIHTQGSAPWLRGRGDRRDGAAQHAVENGWAMPPSRRRRSTPTPSVRNNARSPNGCGADSLSIIQRFV